MPPEQLAKYGYTDMHQFRNWRWFKESRRRPALRPGRAPDRHLQLVVRRHAARPCMASGGMDYYKNHEWYDNAMVIYEYPLPEGVARAFYQVQTTTSAGGGYFEMFMGDEGTIKMSENPGICPRFTAKRARPSWDDWFAKNYLRAKTSGSRRRREPPKWTCAKPPSWRNMRCPCPSTSRPTSRIWRIFSTPSAARPN